MLGIKRATGAVEESAHALTDLANSARDELSDLSVQLRAGAQYGPYIIAAIGVISVVALVVALVAVSRD